MLRGLPFPLTALVWLLVSAPHIAGAENSGDAPLAPTPSTPPREQGLPFLELFHQRDYRGHAQVWTGVADARGLLYFGNYAQILVYDGVRWDRIAVPGATFVRSLALDARGRLWVGAVGAVGYVDTDTPHPPIFVSLADRLPPAARGPGDLANVLVHGDSVYFQSQTWLFRWRNDAFEAWPLPGIGPPSQSMIVAGEFVIQNSIRGWRRPAPGGLEPVTSRLPSLSPTRFTLPLAGDRHLFGTIFNGLFTFDGHTTRPVRTEADDHLSSHFLFNGLRLRDGRFALGLLTGGAVILGSDLSFQRLIDEAAGLPSAMINHAFTDAHGGLWLCLGEGIARVDDSFAATWFRPPSPFGRIDDFAFTRFQGRLFLGVAPELRRLEPSAKGSSAASWQIQQVLGSRQGGRLSALLPVDDTLLIAAADGVYAWKEKTSAQRLVAVRNCRALLASSAQTGRFFAAHAGGIELLRCDGTTWLAEGPLPGLPADVRSLEEDAGGALWAGLADGGVARITFSTTAAPAIARFSLPLSPDASPGEMRLAHAAGRPLFLGPRGLLRFDPATQALVPENTYGARFADGSTRVNAVAEDARGDLWIAPQPAGASRSWSPAALGRATPSGSWHPLAVAGLARIGEILGLRLERTDDREVLWAVGASGVLRIELDALRTPAEPGATLIRDITPLDEAAPLPRGRAATTLAYAQNSLRFRVAAPSLSAQPDVQFETQLTGLGQGARNLSSTAEREFTHLREGRYVFRARARANASAGEWTAPAEFTFTVLPPWWRTPWAWTLWCVLGVGGVGGIVLLRTRTLRHRAQLLENTVAERTTELHARNTELTRLHRLELDEKISARLAGEKARLEMLRYQLNPHFLFNTLNSLYTLVEEHPTAAHMVLRLSEFCRLTLTRGAAHLQTLDDEIHMLNAYLDIEKVRWGESLRVVFDIDPAARSAPIPPFLLLPLVENAIKHGGETSLDVLQIRIAARRRDARTLDLEIANTGHWVTPGTSAAPTAHVGMENLRERLARSYPNAHTLANASADGWVILKLQLTLTDPSCHSSASA